MSAPKSVPVVTAATRVAEARGSRHGPHVRGVRAARSSSITTRSSLRRSVDVPPDELVGQIADRPADVVARGEGRQEVHATPEATQTADVLELGEGRERPDDDVARRRDPGLDDG